MKNQVLFVIICFIFSVTSAHAAAVDTFGIGSKATALGGAFSAYADDPFAVYYNPAGLSQIEGSVFSIGIHAVDPTIKLSDYKVGGVQYADFEDKSDTLIAPHAGYAMKINDKFAFGIAAYAPWGLELDWSSDPAVNMGAYNAYHSYYKRYGITPGMSYKFNDQLSFGVGVTIGRSEAGVDKKKYMLTDMGNYQTGEGTVMQAVDTVIGGAHAASMAMSGNTIPVETTAEAAAFYTNAAEAEADPVIKQTYLTYAAMMGSLAQAGYNNAISLDKADSPDHGADLKAELTDDANYSYNLGIMYKPVETISVGLTYRSKAEAKFEGDVKLNGVKVSDATMNYDHPQQLQFGVRYQPHNKFSIECDMVWTDWSTNREQVMPVSQGVELYALPFQSVTVYEESFDRDWEDTKQLRFGMEYKINEMFTVRSGYFYDPTPIPDNTLDLQWPDADKKTYSVGTGINIGKCTVDIALQYVDIEKARIIGGESENFNESYNHQDVSAKADGYMIGGGFTVSYAF